MHFPPSTVSPLDCLSPLLFLSPLIPAPSNTPTCCCFCPCLSAIHAGFGLIINRANYRWFPLGKLAFLLDTEVIGMPCNVNVYFTPAHSQSFEAHFDPMDVIILQVSGKKKWKLYTPAITLPRKDMIRKPTAEEVEKPYAEIILNAGDSLYLPRGFIHEAVNEFDEPSMHITIGVNVFTSFTWQGAIHFGIDQLQHREIKEELPQHMEKPFPGCGLIAPHDESIGPDDTVSYATMLHWAVIEASSRADAEDLRKTFDLDLWVKLSSSEVGEEHMAVLHYLRAEYDEMIDRLSKNLSSKRAISFLRALFQKERGGSGGEGSGKESQALRNLKAALGPQIITMIYPSVTSRVHRANKCLETVYDDIDKNMRSLLEYLKMRVNFLNVVGSVKEQSYKVMANQLEEQMQFSEDIKGRMQKLLSKNQDDNVETE